MPPHERIFPGSFPSAVDERWNCVYHFVECWCSREPMPNLREVAFDTLESVQYATEFYGDQLSASIQRWLALVEHSAQTGIPGLRDYVMLEPLDSHFTAVDANEFLVLLMQGESDVFWCVDANHLTEIDPPVTVLWQTENQRPETLGNISSVSEFSLAHLFWYNTYSVNCERWFPADLSDEESRTVTSWMTCTLRIHDGMHAIAVWENDCAAALVTNERWEFSLFADPSKISLPSILQLRMQEHRELSRRISGGLP